MQAEEIFDRVATIRNLKHMSPPAIQKRLGLQTSLAKIGFVKRLVLDDRNYPNGVGPPGRVIHPAETEP